LIIVLAPGDEEIVSRSRDQCFNFPEKYGEITYVAGPGRNDIPQAGPHENVFFVGHGVSLGGSGNAEIGEERGRFAFDGIQLWERFGRAVFPSLYAGDVYIDACESADFPAEMFSVIETFRSQSDLTLNNSSVFGRTGSPVGDIPPPGDEAWVEATI
jgi:hypothetical protein